METRDRHRTLTRVVLDIFQESSDLSRVCAFNRLTGYLVNEMFRLSHDSTHLACLALADESLGCLEMACCDVFSKIARRVQMTK